jgi:GxxExxY protein
MNADVSSEVLNRISHGIIGAAQAVSNALGCGFLEKVYENALALELRQLGHRVEQQVGIEVRYKKEIVGAYVADLLVDGQVIVELKATRHIEPIHRAQCLNYLRGTGRRLALVLNFGAPRLEIGRVVFNL